MFIDASCRLNSDLTAQTGFNLHFRECNCEKVISVLVFISYTKFQNEMTKAEVTLCCKMFMGEELKKCTDSLLSRVKMIYKRLL